MKADTKQRQRMRCIESKPSGKVRMCIRSSLVCLLPADAARPRGLSRTCPEWQMLRQDMIFNASLCICTNTHKHKHTSACRTIRHTRAHAHKRMHIHTCAHATSPAHTVFACVFLGWLHACWWCSGHDCCQWLSALNCLFGCAKASIPKY